MSTPLRTPQRPTCFPAESETLAFARQQLAMTARFVRIVRTGAAFCVEVVA